MGGVRGGGALRGLLGNARQGAVSNVGLRASLPISEPAVARLRQSPRRPIVERPFPRSPFYQHLFFAEQQAAGQTSSTRAARMIDGPGEV